MYARGATRLCCMVALLSLSCVGEEGARPPADTGRDSLAAVDTVGDTGRIPETTQGIDGGIEDAHVRAELPGTDTVPKDKDIAFPDTAPESVDGAEDDASGAEDGDGAEGLDTTAIEETSPNAEDVAPVICPAVPDPEPVSEAPMSSDTPAGQVTTTQADGFTDDYLVSGTGALKIGTRREWGATIIFLGMNQGGPGLNATNVIDANDTGREVQIALYDPDRIKQGCAWNASCGQPGAEMCPNSISFLGWNPVQGGNRCNEGSGVVSVNAEPGRLEAVVQPLHWNPDWEKKDCQNDGCADPILKTLTSDVLYTQRLRWVGSHLVEMQMTVENLSNIAHAPTNQEFPTVYAGYGNGTPNLNVLLDSDGNQVTIDNPANDGFFEKSFESPGGWVSLQNAALDYGVGLYYENRQTTYQGWQKAGVFNNVRAKFPFGLAGKGTVRARAYLVVGSFALVKETLEALDATLPPSGALESPAPDVAVGNEVTVKGWALDNKGVALIEIVIDGEVHATAATNVPRPDICARYPGYADCPSVGFETVVSTKELTPCPHLLEIRATDTDGNSRTIARRRFTVAAPLPCAGPADCDDGLPCTIESCLAGSCSWEQAPPNGAATESCNGYDDDCDGEADEADAVGCTPYYSDTDGDGAGAGVATCLCGPIGDATSTSNDDCDDTNAAIAPGKPELCNGQDDNCDGVTDEGPVCGDATHPIYRFVRSDAEAHDHMLGLDAEPLPGYSLEGVAFHLFTDPAPDRVPLYQVYHPGAVDHMPTLNPDEGSPAYQAPQTLGYCTPTETPQTPYEGRRLFAGGVVDHFMSADPLEWNVEGYILEGTLCWVP